ncbi:ABC transporter permease [Candidatus Hepatincola sp. Av]
MFSNSFIIIKLAYRNVFSNWNRNKVIVMIIAVAFTLIQMLLALSEGFGLQMQNFALDNLLGHMKILQKDYKLDPSVQHSFVISSATLAKIANIEGVKGVTKRIQAPIVIKSERDVRNAVLVGVDINTEKNLSFIGKDYGYTKLKEVLQNNQVLIGRKLLENLETKIDYKIVASGQNSNNKLVENALFIKDIYTSGLPKVEEIYIIAEINSVAKMYNLPNKVTEVSILLTNDNKYFEVFTKVQQLLPKDTLLYGWGDLMPFLKNWLSLMKVNLSIFFGIVFFAAAIPLTNTLLISILERMYEFGIMQALGVKKFYIAFSIMVEAFIIVVLGLIGGLIIGLLFSFILQKTGINISGVAAGASKLGLGDHIYAKVNLVSTLRITLIMLIIGIIAGIYPAFKAMLYNSVQALSHRG